MWDHHNDYEQDNHHKDEADTYVASAFECVPVDDDSANQAWHEAHKACLITDWAFIQLDTDAEQIAEDSGAKV